MKGYKEKIYKMIKEKKIITLKELTKTSGVNKNTVRSAVIALTNEGLIDRIEKGTYKIKSEK